MNAVVAIFVIPLALLAAAIGMALSTGDPLWLVFGAVIAIATGYLARRSFGS